MLDPRDRALLLESLRPPTGYRLDQAIGTSFSLDLIALLVAPLAFTLFTWDDVDGKPAADHYALLAALRENADRIALFCQAGQIAVPPERNLLVSEIEDSVVEVGAPNGGVFHPKVWVLRFVDDENEDVEYRFLCLSRNLTFDRCWDTLIRLDGELTHRKNAFSANHPLGDFISALPAMARRPVDSRIDGMVRQMEREVRRVRWELPPDVDEIRFWPLGIGRDDNPLRGDIRRLLVVSPFLAAAKVSELAQLGSANVLVSRLDSLDGFSADQLAGFERLAVLNDAAEPEDALAVNDAAVPVAPAFRRHDPSVDHRLHGLHAKVYVADAGWRGRMWLGSANATNAAFGGNVEFLVELEGKKSRCGIDACLGLQDATGMNALLVDYEPQPSAVERDEVAEELERLVDHVRREVSAAGLELTAEPADEEYAVTLGYEGPPLSPDVTVRVWLATTRREAAARELLSDTPTPLGTVPPEMLTPFLAIEVRAERDGRAAEARFTVKAVLAGGPADRREAVLRTILDNRSGLLRFLLLLLSQGRGVGLAAALATRFTALGEETDRAAFSDGLNLPVLEAMLQAADRDPIRLRGVRRLLDDLSKTEHGRALLGEDLPAVCQAIWDGIEARQ